MPTATTAAIEALVDRAGARQLGEAELFTSLAPSAIEDRLRDVLRIVRLEVASHLPNDLEQRYVPVEDAEEPLLITREVRDHCMECRSGCGCFRLNARATYTSRLRHDPDDHVLHGEAIM